LSIVNSQLSLELQLGIGEMMASAWEWRKDFLIWKFEDLEI